MKATGIVRRIDDLGRVVVPKEIRRTLRIREGDPLEIFTDKDGGIVLRKYSPIGELSEYARDFAAALGEVLDKTVIVCDRDTVVSVSGEHTHEYTARPISRALEEHIDSRNTFLKRGGQESSGIPIYDGEDASRITAHIIRPIISDAQPIGEVILLSRESSATIGEVEEKSVSMAAAFLGSQMQS